ncbi:hypothetical protein [Arthrobacter cavernae]|uniref:Uncharacterized protein n=1 Tax=Arthrobacter cavernae TaxID=2817681 RepID=A0A939HJ57_9MICC|nr:hypothetical protein [Arthrobacter cavernae]MBO1268238.1 hypothetical protein [Arthrobacter cavernae]
MWMLIRANALGAEVHPELGTRTLAACPDSAERGDPWRWTVSVNDADAERVVVETDGDHIRQDSRQYTDGYVGELFRRSGEQLVVAPLRGEARVAAVDGPWERWLRPGDVFILEGEDDEAVRLSVTPGDAVVDVVRLAPTTGRALRWVP